MDEAYSLVQDNKDAYGNQALNMLIKYMDDMRDELVIVFAGYALEMERFLSINPGLRRRVPNQITFNFYSFQEIKEIFNQQINEYSWVFDEDALTLAIAEMKDMAEKGTATGGDLRNMVERISLQQDLRLYKQEKIKAHELKRIVYSDVTPDPFD